MIDVCIISRATWRGPSGRTGGWAEVRGGRRTGPGGRTRVRRRAPGPSVLCPLCARCGNKPARNLNASSSVCLTFQVNSCDLLQFVMNRKCLRIMPNTLPLHRFSFSTDPDIHVYLHCWNDFLWPFFMDLYTTLKRILAKMCKFINQTFFCKTTNVMNRDFWSHCLE